MSVDDGVLDWASAPNHFRGAHERLKAEVRRLRARESEESALRLENAALRAGLDVDEPATKLALQTFRGVPEPGAVYAHFIETTASVLAGARAGRSWSELADVLEPVGGPTDG